MVQYGPFSRIVYDLKRSNCDTTRTSKTIESMLIRNRCPVVTYPNKSKYVSNLFNELVNFVLPRDTGHCVAVPVSKKSGRRVHIYSVVYSAAGHRGNILYIVKLSDCEQGITHFTHQHQTPHWRGGFKHMRPLEPENHARRRALPSVQQQLRLGLHRYSSPACSLEQAQAPTCCSSVTMEHSLVS